MSGSAQIPLITRTSPFFIKAPSFSCLIQAWDRLWAFTALSLERTIVRCFSTHVLRCLSDCSLAGPVLTNTFAHAIPQFIQVISLFIVWLKKWRWDSRSYDWIMKAFAHFSASSKRLIFRSVKWQIRTVFHSVYLAASRLQVKWESI